VLTDGFGDFLDAVFVFDLQDFLIGLIHLFLGFDIETEMIIEPGAGPAFAGDGGDGCRAVEPDHDGTRAGLHHLHAQDLFIEAAGGVQVIAFHGAVGEKVQIKQGLLANVRFGCRLVHLLSPSM